MPGFLTRAVCIWRSLLLLFLLGSSAGVLAQEGPESSASEARLQNEVEQLNEPLYNPFVERYVLDELKQLRIEQAQTKNEVLQQIFDREHQSVDRAVSYATDTVTYFFYLIAAATSVLVLVGWTSIRDIKERVHMAADEEVSKLVSEYERRLAFIEEQLQQKTLHIEENREEIELTQEIQALWLRAQQEQSPASKIYVYDQILSLRKDDVEALTYKADAVLELRQPQWAVNLCTQALAIDPDNGHSKYQLACAYALLGQTDKAVLYLKEAIDQRSAYAAEAAADPALESLRNLPEFQDIQGNMDN
ncbi:MAG: hypothetical protein RLN82_01325 [Pseudomonadales bacterium]